MWEISQLDASSTSVGSLRNPANSIVELRVTKKKGSSDSNEEKNKINKIT
jgi:hypothetical protein